MTTVAEEGNARVGDMTKEELTQCVLDIKSWFARNGCDVERKACASSADFQRLQKAIGDVPLGLQLLLSESNGGLYFEDKAALSAEEMISLVNEVESHDKWNNYLFPFCGDAGGMLAINVKSGKVVEWDEDDGSGDVLADTFNEYLESYRNSLLGGKFEFVKDVGAIEKVGGGARK